MIKLIKMEKDKYVVACSRYNVFTISDLATAAENLSSCGVEPEEIHLALKDMEQNKTNCADFGINRMFIFTTNFTSDFSKVA